MSAPERLDAVRDWIRLGREDLAGAEALLTDDRFVPRHACWLAQQAAEKALKGALTFEQVPFPFRHDLDALRNLLPDGWKVKVHHDDLAELTQWAVEARYPGDWPDAVVADARLATDQARAVYEIVVQDLRARGVAPTESMSPER